MRKLLHLLLLMLIPSILSAGSLEMFRLDHPVYREMDALYTIEGKASPFGARPWTELDIMRLLSIGRCWASDDCGDINRDAVRNSSYTINRDWVWA